MNQAITRSQRGSLRGVRCGSLEIANNTMAFNRGPIGFVSSAIVIAAVAGTASYRMAKQRIKPVEISFYGNKDSLIVLDSLRKNATDSIRHEAIKIIVKTHNINTASLKSISYDPALSDLGICSVMRQIRIGARAFSQDMAWLANVVLHEVIHADQFKCYFDLGVVGKLKQARRSQIRQIKALDEFESYYVCWRGKKILGLNSSQVKALLHRMRIANVEIDNEKVTSLVKKGLFEQARMILLDSIIIDQ